MKLRNKFRDLECNLLLILFSSRGQTIYFLRTYPCLNDTLWEYAFAFYSLRVKLLIIFWLFYIYAPRKLKKINQSPTKAYGEQRVSCQCQHGIFTSESLELIAQLGRARWRCPIRLTNIITTNTHEMNWMWTPCATFGTINQRHLRKIGNTPKMEQN